MRMRVIVNNDQLVMTGVLVFYMLSYDQHKTAVERSKYSIRLYL